MTLKKLLLATALTGVLAGVAQAEIAVKIGVMNDRSGIYTDVTGEGSAVAARTS